MSVLSRSKVKLRVNPIRCTAHGLCAELLPERVTLDEWGYPIVDGTPIAPGLMADARRAANACPTLALVFANAES
jgi:ferredoxin